MGFFTCMLILIVLYCPWLILVGGIVIVCIVALVYALLEDKKQKERYSRKRKANR